ncbi:MAG: hypothetical protein AABZ61_14190, partial [Bacteroidota bacterium]
MTVPFQAGGAYPGITQAGDRGPGEVKRLPVSRPDDLGHRPAFEFGWVGQLRGRRGHVPPRFIRQFRAEPVDERRSGGIPDFLAYNQLVYSLAD